MSKKFEKELLGSAAHMLGDPALGPLAIEPVYYAGNVTTCDGCSGTLGSVMYDARTTSGQWGNLCHSCWQRMTTKKLGTGYGQKYKRVIVPVTDAQRKNNATAMPRERWLKVAG